MIANLTAYQSILFPDAPLAPEFERSFILWWSVPNVADWFVQISENNTYIFDGEIWAE